MQKPHNKSNIDPKATASYASKRWMPLESILGPQTVTFIDG